MPPSLSRSGPVDCRAYPVNTYRAGGGHDRAVARRLGLKGGQGAFDCAAAPRPRQARAAAPSASIWLGLPIGATVRVDTAPFIDLLEDHPTLAPRFVGLVEAERRGELTVAITPATVAELLVGPLKAGQDGLARRCERELQAYPLAPIDGPLAAQAARRRVRYRLRLRLRLPDALQLAAALEIGAQALVTHDRDFSAVDGLQVLTGA